MRDEESQGGCILFGLFRKSFSKLAGKGDRCVERGDVGLARGEYLSALRAFREETDDAGEKTRVEEALAAVELELAHRKMAEAKRFLTAELYDRAFATLEDVEELADGRDEALCAEADALLTQLESGELGEDFEEAEVEAEPEEDPDQELELLIQTMSEERQEVYRTAGPVFRDGYLALNDGDGEIALAAFESAQPGPWTDYERGRSLALLQRHEEAVEAFHTAAAALEDDGVSPVLVGCIQAAVGAERYEEGRAAVERFIAIHGEDDPDGAVLQLGLAAAEGRFDEGEASARAYLKPNPSQYRVWRTLGDLLEKAGRPEAAAEAYEAVMSLRWRYDPTRKVVDLDPFATSRLAQILLERGQGLDRAMTLLNALSLYAVANSENMGDDSWGLALMRAECQEKQGDGEAALATLRGILEEAPESVQAAIQERLDALEAGPVESPEEPVDP